MNKIVVVKGERMNKYIKFLFILSAIVAVFLNDISSSIFQSALGLMDEILPLLLFLLAYSRNLVPNRLKSWNKCVSLFLFYTIYIIFLSFPEILLTPSLGGYVFLYKISTFFMLLFVMDRFESFSGMSYEDYFRFIIILSIVYCIFNTVFYFVPLPIWDENSSRLFLDTVGRITCGYAPTDVVVICLSLCLLLQNKLLFHYKIRILFIIVLIVETFLLASGTGIFCLIFIGLVYLYYSKYRFKFKAISFLCLTMFFFSVIVEPIVKKNKELSGTMVMIESRINQVFSPNKVEYNTLDIRKYEYKKATSFIKSNMDEIFGIGFGKYTNKMEKVNFDKTIFIENQFDSFRISYGIMGFILYICMLLSWIKPIPKNKSIKFLLITTLFIFISNNYTATPMYGFQESFFFTLILSYIRKHVRSNSLLCSESE